jgi:nucleoside-diphosphate-sugar epimerase
MRVAVTGASGFIGTHVVASLAARGDTAIPMTRPFDPATLTSALQLQGVDVVVHLAGVVSAIRREDFFAANVGGTEIVARAARDARARLVHISSLAAAGPATASAPRSEEDEPHPITAYGESKLEGERVVRDLEELHWTILRPGVVYGPGDRAMLPLFRYARLGVLPLVGEASAAYTFIYIDDAVRAIIAAVDGGPANDVLFIGHAQPVTPGRLLETVAAAVRGPHRVPGAAEALACEAGQQRGSPAVLIHVPRSLTRAAAALGDLVGALTGRPATINSRRYVELYAPGFVCRVDRMRERLGVAANVDLMEGVFLTAAWYRDHAWLRGRPRPALKRQAGTRL